MSDNTILGGFDSELTDDDIHNKLNEAIREIQELRRDVDRLQNAARPLYVRYTPERRVNDER